MLLLTKIIRQIKTRGIIGSWAYVVQYFYQSFRVPGNIQILGIFGSLVYISQYFLQRYLKKGHIYNLISKHAHYPLLCRGGTSDIWVFDQIFIDREYRCIDGLSSVSLIIDCGANVGYTSAYLLSRFEGSYLIAIEPDRENYLMLTKNLKPYNNRVKMLHCAVWSHQALLSMSESIYRDGEAWAHQVRESRVGETAIFSGLDIASILGESGYDRISILKMDIEGAEGVIFSSPAYKAWIDKVDMIVIELHDDSSFGKCSEIFFSAINEDDFEVSRCAELTICKRRGV